MLQLAGVPAVGLAGAAWGGSAGGGRAGPSTQYLQVWGRCVGRPPRLLDGLSAAHIRPPPLLYKPARPISPHQTHPSWPTHSAASMHCPPHPLLNPKPRPPVLTSSAASAQCPLAVGRPASISVSSSSGGSSTECSRRMASRQAACCARCLPAGCVEEGVGGERGKVCLTRSVRQAACWACYLPVFVWTRVWGGGGGGGTN